jgi:hypothetical protein
MNAQLFISVGWDHLKIEYTPASKESSWGSWWPAKKRAPLAKRPTAAAAAQQQTWGFELAFGIQPALDAAWASIAQAHGASRSTIDLRVEIGQRHCHLGLLPMDIQTQLSSTAIEQYLRAWVQQIWQQEPSSRILRWEWASQGPSSSLWVSSFDRDIYESLQRFADAHKLKFVSCVPAIWHALAQLKPSPSAASQPSRANAAPKSSAPDERLVVWTEAALTGDRCPTVQLLQCVSSQPQALWRGWLPSSSDRDAEAQALDAALHRFALAHAIAPSTPVVHLQWPASSAAHTRGAH